MTTNKKSPDNQITVYQTPDGKINIEVLYANENNKGGVKYGQKQKTTNTKQHCGISDFHKTEQ